MPRLVHIARSGENKAALRALAPGESLERPTFRAARVFYFTAREMGLRVTVHRIAKGQPAHRVTRLP